MIKYPVLIKYIPFVVLLAIGFVLKDGILVELAINWVLLLLIEKKSINVLGIFPTWNRTSHLLIGVSIAAGCCALYFYVQTILSGSTWTLNQSFTTTRFFSSTWWTMQSVLYEELIFRGALLYIAIKKIDAKKAIVLSAICFGIYHWFSMGAFGNWVFMAYLFIGTGIMGYIFALAFEKTNSMYLPIGFHFGWNLITNVVFSQGPIGLQLLFLKRGDNYSLTENIIVLLMQFLVFPVFGFLYIKRLKINIPKQII